jgi:hypothetical protein
MNPSPQEFSSTRDLLDLDFELADPTANRYNNGHLGCWTRFHIWFSKLPEDRKRSCKAAAIGVIIVFVFMSIAVIKIAQKTTKTPTIS